MLKQKPLVKPTISNDQTMVEQWRESALEEEKRRREDREKVRLGVESNFRQMDEWTSGETMRPEGTCPCGKHKGVVFMNGSIRLNPTLLCPVSVWLFWQKKGVVNKDWKQVLSERPIDAMLNNFRLGS